jgi:hypothetical protein
MVNAVNLLLLMAGVQCITLHPNVILLCEISSSHGGEYDVAPCSHVEVDRRFRGAYCLHHQGDHRPEDSKLYCVSCNILERTADLTIQLLLQ